MLYCWDQLSLQPSSVVVCCHFSCLCHPSQWSSLVGSTDQGLPKLGVPAPLSPKLCEESQEEVRNQHLLNFSSKMPALLWLQVAFPPSSATMAVSVSGSVSESFSIVLHPASCWRDKLINFISPPDFAYSTVALNICSLGSAVSAAYGDWC